MRISLFFLTHNNNTWEREKRINGKQCIRVVKVQLVRAVCAVIKVSVDFVGKFKPSSLVEFFLNIGKIAWNLKFIFLDFVFLLKLIEIYN